MNKNILIHGLIAGFIVSVLMVSSIFYLNNYGDKPDFDLGMLLGYASMLLAFSFVFIGIKNYRDNYNHGVISFVQALKIGFSIVLIAATIYVIIWLITYFFFMPDFMDKYASHSLDKLRESGTDQVTIDKQSKEMADFIKMYKNPFFNAMISYTEILPAGLIITLISSLILKKKN